MFAITSQYHPVTTNFFTRVLAATGTISATAQIGTNEFTKKIFASGLREKIRLCMPVVTQTLNGAITYLFRNGTETATINQGSTNFTYAVATGIRIPADREAYIDTGVANNAIDYNNHHIGAYFSSSQLINDYMGFNADGLNQGIAFYPLYSDSTMYHDVYGGGDGTSFSGSDITGLHLAEKNQQTMRFISRGSQIFSAGGKLLTGTIRSDNTRIGGGDAGNNKNGVRDYCGFTCGQALTNTEHTIYYQAWQNLQKSVSSSRP